MSGGPLGSNPPSPPEGPPWCTCGCGENKPMVWNQLTQNWVNPTPRQRAEMSLSLSNNSFALLVEKLEGQPSAAYPFLNEELPSSSRRTDDNVELNFRTATVVSQPSATATASKAKVVTIGKPSSSQTATTVRQPSATAIAGKAKVVTIVKSSSPAKIKNFSRRS